MHTGFGHSLGKPAANSTPRGMPVACVARGSAFPDSQEGPAWATPTARCLWRQTERSRLSTRDGAGCFIGFLGWLCSSSCGERVLLTLSLLELLFVLFLTCCLACTFSCFWDRALTLLRACLSPSPFDMCGWLMQPPLTEWLLGLRHRHITIGCEATTYISFLVTSSHCGE